MIMIITFIVLCSEEECLKAYQMFNGRWYAQKQLSCEFCPVQKWKSAICGESLAILLIMQICVYFKLWEQIL